VTKELGFAKKELNRRIRLPAVGNYKCFTLQFAVTLRIIINY